MKRTYWKHENIDTTKPFKRFIDESFDGVYDCYYSNLKENGNKLYGVYDKITQEEAWQIEESPEYKGVR